MAKGKINILFIADVNRFSHDLKWISFFSNRRDEYACYQVALKQQYDNLTTNDLEWFEQNSILLLPPIEHYSVRYYLRTRRYLKYINSLIKRYKIDLIHVHYAEPNALWALKKSYFNCPMVLTTRGTDILRSIPDVFTNKNRSIINLILKRLYRKALQKFNYITCTSLPQMKMVENITGSSNNIHLIRTGVEVNKIISASKSIIPKELQNTKFILFPRSMKPLYNHEFSIRALSKLSEQLRQKYAMVFVNADGPDQQYVDEIKKMLTNILPLSYVFLNSQPEEIIYAMYKNADLVLMNPLSDGTPVTALEAMLCEVPVIVGPLNYDEDLFKNTVYKLKSWDEKELSELITNVLTDMKTSVTLKNAKETVMNLADRKKELSKLDNIYKALVK